MSAHRILIVDDYGDSVEATSMLLTRLGHECVTATNGTRALQLVETFRPDIVLLDIGLPDISGYEVARALRERHGGSLYIAALTGWGQPEDRLRSVDAGFDQHILKPVTSRVLQDLLGAADRRGQGTSQESRTV